MPRAAALSSRCPGAGAQHMLLRRGAAALLLPLLVALLVLCTAAHAAAADHISADTNGPTPLHGSGTGAGGATGTGNVIGIASVPAAAAAAAAPTPTHRFFNRLDANRDGQLEPDELARHITSALGGGADDAASNPGITATGPDGSSQPSTDAPTSQNSLGPEDGSGTAPFAGSAGDISSGDTDVAAATAGSGGPLFMTHDQVQQAVQQAVDSVDGSDAGSTISLSELERHLSRAVLRGVRVSDWVAHGLSLPRYRGAFMTHGVTPLDFPYLVEGGGDLLASELGVTSKLHQQRILRAMQRQMLALGREPSPPSALACRPTSGPTAAADGTGGAVTLRLALSWRAPEDPGQPHFHAYQLQRLALGSGSGSGSSGGSAAAVTATQGWTTVGEIDAEAVPAAVVDRVPAAGVYRYRIAAWNLHGRSAWAVSGDCAAGAYGATGGTEIAAVVAAGGTQAAVNADGRVASGADWTAAGGESLQSKQQQQPPGLSSRTAALAPSPPWAGQPGGVSTAAASGSGAALLNLMGSSQGLGAAAGAPAAPRSPTARPRSPAPAAAAAVAAVTAQLGRWIWALANSLLLVIIPLCVRLLPLPLLSRAQRAIVRLLMLPLQPAQGRHPGDAGTSGSSGADASSGTNRASNRASTNAPASATPATTAAKRPPIQPGSLAGPSEAAAAAAASNSTLGGPVVPPSSRPMTGPTPMPASNSTVNSGTDACQLRGSPAPESSQQRALRLLLNGTSGGGGGGNGGVMIAAGSQPGSEPPLGLPRSGSEGRLAAIGGGRGALSFQDVSVASAYASALERAQVQQRTGRPASPLGSSVVTAAAAVLRGSSPLAAVAPGPAGSGDADEDDDWWGDEGMSDGDGAAAEEASALPNGQVDKRRCAAPGCNQRFDMRNLRALWERHYCGRCQRAFCLAHTAYSTHGPGGQCGADSGCCCFACFAEYTSTYRAQLSARNTLRDRQRSFSGGPLGAGGMRRRSSSGGGGGGVDVSSERRLSWAQASGSPLQRATDVEQQQQQQQHGTGQRQGQQPTEAVPPANGSKARALWRRGWAKLKARDANNSGGSSSGGNTSTNR